MKSDADYKMIFDRVAKHIKRRYRVSVKVEEVAKPNYGELDGMEIRIDPAQKPEAALYILVHLFGHTVQWNTAPELRVLGMIPDPGKDESVMARLLDMEKQASRYGVTLLHEVGFSDMDTWVSDYFASDWRYLSHYYRTGERLPWSATFRAGEPLLEPLPIPEFTPARWEQGHFC